MSRRDWMKETQSRGRDILRRDVKEVALPAQRPLKAVDPIDMCAADLKEFCIEKLREVPSHMIARVAIGLMDLLDGPQLEIQDIQRRGQREATYKVWMRPRN